MNDKKLKRTGTHRHNAPISILNPMPDGPEKNILPTGSYIWNGDKFVPRSEYREPSAAAVHTDQAVWLNKFDWGAGKTWADHGGRRGREDWMKGKDGDGYVCKG